MAIISRLISLTRVWTTDTVAVLVTGRNSNKLGVRMSRMIFDDESLEIQLIFLLPCGLLTS